MLLMYFHEKKPSWVWKRLYLHFSLGLRRLQMRMTTTMTIKSATIHAAITATIMMIFALPICFKRPMPWTSISQGLPAPKNHQEHGYWRSFLTEYWYDLNYNVETKEIFCNSDFSWNWFCETSVLHFLPFWQSWRIFAIPQGWNLLKSNSESLKLISRKIWEAEKLSLNLHTVVPTLLESNDIVGH